PVDENGKEVKPSLTAYPVIPWETLDLEQLNMRPNIPWIVHTLLRRFTKNWESLYVVPIESGRGCPYGCDFCTVTGFFGDSIRYRSNERIVNKILPLKRRDKAPGRKI